MESDKDVQDLKSTLGKAKKQVRTSAKKAQEYEKPLKNGKLENESLQSTLRDCDAKSNQDGEDSQRREKFSMRRASKGEVVSFIFDKGTPYADKLHL